MAASIRKEKRKMTVKELLKQYPKMEELKNIKVVVRWGKNGRKYIWEKPSQKKIAELISKYDYDQICDGCLWLQ